MSDWVVVVEVVMVLLLLLPSRCCRLPRCHQSCAALLCVVPQVYSWGWNDRGTLGHGHREQERVPRRVQALLGICVVQVGVWVWGWGVGCVWVWVRGGCANGWVRQYL